jgi:hypothetical protein
MNAPKKKIGLKRKLGVKKPAAETAVVEEETATDAVEEVVEEVTTEEEALTEQSDDVPVDDAAETEVEEEVEETAAPAPVKKKVVAKKTAAPKKKAAPKAGPAVAAAKKIVLGSKRKSVAKVVEEGERIPHDVLYRRFHDFLGTPEVDLQPETLKQSTDLFKAFEAFMAGEIIPHHPVKFMGEMMRHKPKAARVYCPPTTEIATLIPAHYVALWNMEINGEDISADVPRIYGKKIDGVFVPGDWDDGKFTASKDKALIANVAEILAEL